MARDKVPGTPAIRLLKQHKIKFIPRFYAYTEKGGTAASAKELQTSEYQIIKTLVMEDDQQQPFVVLMHGSCEVSRKHLARQLSVKQVVPCSEEKANRLTGYQVGGISPFGTRQRMPIYMEETIAGLDTILVNGGKRGMLVEINPLDLQRVLEPTQVSVAN